jgi:geranylgeranyl reductase family protein
MTSNTSFKHKAMNQTDICIIGAGPGGAATALKLSQLGIPCTLLDREFFPRDKICGDAISGKAIAILRRIDPAIMEAFDADASIQTDVWGIRFVAPNNKKVEVPYRPGYDPLKDPRQGYVSKRLDFDQHLIAAVKQRKNIALHEGLAIEHYEKTDQGYRIASADGSFTAEPRLLIVANGANSNFSRRHAGLEKDEKHHAGAVRAYYRNVRGMHPDGFIELHFMKEINPGYLWIFPLPGGYANVGVGMRSDYISKRRFNLKRGLVELIEGHPELRERFCEAELVGKITGYGLPLGSKKRHISGDHLMLVGDAGHLIDPLSGEGIGNAIYSGFIAAEQAKACFEQGNFSADFMRAYDVRVDRVLGKEMEISYALQRMMARTWLVNLLSYWASRNRNLIDTISLMYTDMEVRRRALNPIFWIKMLAGGATVK